MLEKFLNKNVEISIAHYAGTMRSKNPYIRKGIVTRVDDNFIELDNNEVVAIKYIATIKSL